MVECIYVSVHAFPLQVLVNQSQKVHIFWLVSELVCTNTHTHMYSLSHCILSRFHSLGIQMPLSLWWDIQLCLDALYIPQNQNSYPQIQRWLSQTLFWDPSLSLSKWSTGLDLILLLSLNVTAKILTFHILIYFLTIWWYVLARKRKQNA